ncbi:PaaI family thioesterase [Nocardia heshunensis]
MASDDINAGFGEVLGLKYSEVTPDRVSAELAIDPSLHQPDGIVHGGVYCAVVEALGSVGGSCWFGERGRVVGVNNNTDFLRAVREGILYAVAEPVHRGRSQQVWTVTIRDGGDTLVARGTLRLANLATGEVAAAV